ncbi:hypothetical protein B7Z17_04750, partial [Candidatus Saccharibacteria bacterium 32-49-10]
MQDGAAGEEAAEQIKYQQVEDVSGTDAQAILMMAKELVAVPDGDNVWLSHERAKAAKLPLQQAVAILEHVPIIGHDLKHFLKSLLAAYPEVKLPEIHHDTSQGSFLLNPLRKSRLLTDLIGAETLDDPKQQIGAIWALYEEQSKALDSLPKLAHVARTIDFPLIPVLARMEVRGLRLDSAQLATMNAELTGHIADIQARMFEMVGYEFNIASPTQLAEVLFTKLQLPTAGVKRGKTGLSTGQKELDKLRGQHPIIELIEQFRELTKLQNTYVESLPKLIDEHSRIHTT